MKENKSWKREIERWKEMFKNEIVVQNRDKIEKMNRNDKQQKIQEWNHINVSESKKKRTKTNIKSQDEKNWRIKKKTLKKCRKYYFFIFEEMSNNIFFINQKEKISLDFFFSGYWKKIVITIHNFFRGKVVYE